MDFPEIPITYIVALLVIGLVILRAFGIDTFTTAGLSMIIGYITGKHVEQAKTNQENQ